MGGQSLEEDQGFIETGENVTWIWSKYMEDTGFCLH
jgi:hypothetical protein